MKLEKKFNRRTRKLLKKIENNYQESSSMEEGAEYSFSKPDEIVTILDLQVVGILTGVFVQRENTVIQKGGRNPFTEFYRAVR